MEIIAIIAGFGVAYGVGRLLFRLMFDGIDEFWECVRFSLMPDLISAFRGEWMEDIAKSFKLSVFLVLTGGAAAITYYVIAGIGGS